SPIGAHMFVLYFACLSAFTPLVELAAYAAAGIADGKPMRGAMTAVKVRSVAYIIPYVLLYGRAVVLEGSFSEIIVATITALIGAFTLASSVEGWFLAATANIIVRLLLISSSLLLIVPGILTDTLGITIILMAIGYQIFVKRRNFNM